MNVRAKEKSDTKTALLQAGMDLMVEKGYTNTGINDVLTMLGVPKGSFYHYFDSKEKYTVEIIRFFDVSYSEALTAALGNSTQSPLNRMRSYCEQQKAMLAAQCCRKGCLVGNLSQEMSDQSEVLRTELCRVMDKWCDIIAVCIEEGQNLNEIKTNRTAREFADLFSSGWAGAVMRAKTLKSTEPLDLFITVMFDDILKA